MCAIVLLPHSVVVYAGSISPQYSLATTCVSVVLPHSVVVYGLSRPTIQSSYDVCTCCTATFCGCVRALPPHNTIQLRRGYPLYCNILWLCTGYPSPQYSLATPCVPVVLQHSVVVYGLSLPTIQSSYNVSTCCTATFCGCVRGIYLPTIQSSHTVCTRCTATLGFLSPQYNPATMCALVLLPHSVVVYAGSISPQYNLATTCVSVVLPHSVVVYGLSRPTIQSSYNVSTCCTATFCGCVRALPPHNTIQLQRFLSTQSNLATMCAPVLLPHSVVMYAGSISPRYSLATSCVPVVLQHSVVVYGLSLPTIQSSYNVSTCCTATLVSLSPQYNPPTTCVPVVLQHPVVLYRLSLHTIQSSYNVCTCFTASSCGYVRGIYLPTIQSSHDVCTCCSATFCGYVRALPPHNTIQLRRVYLMYCNILWLCTGYPSPQYSLATPCVPVVLQHSVVVYGLSLPTIQSSYNALSPHNTIQLQRVYLLYCNILWFCPGSLSPQYNPATTCVPVVLEHFVVLYRLSLPTIQSSSNVCTCFTASFCGCVHGIYLPTIQSSHNACTCCIATFCGCAQALSPHNPIHLQRVYLLYYNILWFCTGFLSTQYNLATMCAPVLLPHSVVMYAGSISPRYSLATPCVPVVLPH
ncbi:hypothetical protein J6590_027431 [Homalodisca vitripennis]|nr:hypothetical protein J6590_027431 [Homalodisca vitripennis]